MTKSRMILALIFAFLLGVGISQLALNFLALPAQTSNQNRNPEIDLKIFEQSFQREIDELDRNWQQYHTTLENFKEGSVDLESTVESFGLILEEQKQRARIAELKAQLAATDYAVIKIAEGAAAAEDYADVIEQRQAWREEINALEGTGIR